MVIKLHKNIQKKYWTVQGATIDQRILQSVLLIKKIPFSQILAEPEFSPKMAWVSFNHLLTSDFMHETKKPNEPNFKVGDLCFHKIIILKVLISSWINIRYLHMNCGGYKTWISVILEFFKRLPQRLPRHFPSNPVWRKMTENGGKMWKMAEKDGKRRGNLWGETSIYHGRVNVGQVGRLLWKGV